MVDLSQQLLSLGLYLNWFIFTNAGSLTLEDERESGKNQAEIRILYVNNQYEISSVND